MGLGFQLLYLNSELGDKCFYQRKLQHTSGVLCICRKAQVYRQYPVLVNLLRSRILYFRNFFRSFKNLLEAVASKSGRKEH
jgi:hypothetical protein